MSSIVSAFDKHLQPKQLGEKGHVEFTWSVEPDQLITQLFFQLVRSKDTSDLQNQLNYLLSHLRWSNDESQLLILYKLIGQTRDIVSGKGECDLTWMQLEVWSRFYPELAYQAFVHCVDSRHESLSGHQYGSWKDIKYFLAYLKNNTQQGEAHPLIERILKELVVPALQVDAQLFSEKKAVSLLGRWIPR